MPVALGMRYNRSPQEECNSSVECTDDDDEAVPDLMSEGLTCWTDLLMDDLPNDKLLAIPDYGPLSPSGFLSIGLAPAPVYDDPTPSLPASLFPTRSADSSTAEALAQEARLCEPANEPAAPDLLLRQSDAASWSPPDIDGSLLDPVPREKPGRSCSRAKRYKPALPPLIRKRVSRVRNAALHSRSL